MPLIDWNESFSVNIEEIDEQHKRWIAMINDLHDSLLKDHTNDINHTAVKTMESMKEYVRDHFIYEEDYMRVINYPDFVGHQNIHCKFYEQISKYYDDLKANKILLNTDIMKTLINWLKNHIIDEDSKYSIFAQEGDSSSHISQFEAIRIRGG
ncbi:MAG: hemerythrin [Candidatus Scalindua sp. AMX11]|nr:MAG: hemerythrin [Candidatus Scalindua sp.]NOG82666.1 hemerythrin family protein [Planctomycetota bacterium]RZV95240.1 MAG: bacteriohemerythrin [Candidatus Scalindua sp. SCAELEC01]TDE66280.1 MAG: hemerythrin [Candidatus Scalindua sp. AMX11]GJQ57903.1 MAG: hemerythrin [Candidatus Scalindua sp.]